MRACHPLLPRPGPRGESRAMERKRKRRNRKTNLLSQHHRDERGEPPLSDRSVVRALCRLVCCLQAAYVGRWECEEEMRISYSHNDGPGPWFTQMDDAPLS
jgi:hypothetical protein